MTNARALPCDGAPLFFVTEWKEVKAGRDRGVKAEAWRRERRQLSASSSEDAGSGLRIRFSTAPRRLWTWSFCMMCWT
jgi:hypothetical protein